ncbi:unnamed protein product [Rhodiola kirilowii]
MEKCDSPSEVDKQWFMEAMRAQTVDVVNRMKEISLVIEIPKKVLEEQGVTPSDLEDMLGELQEYVESIDMANGKNINQSWHAFTLHTK